ncbi:MAG: type IV secretion protein IcmS [Legionellales bacterium]|nr:type IV secretion protein IcmS [Legionellales bacterium]
MSISEHLAAISESLQCSFTLRDQPISAEKVFSPTGLLPSIMRRADQLASFCLGSNLGCTFEDAPGTMLGTRVVMDDKVSMTLRLLCATDIIIELIQTAPTRDATPLDDLMYD